MARWWEYLPWREFLKGHAARLLPGLKKGEYVLRAGPGETAPRLASLTGKDTFTVIEVEGEWLAARVAPDLRGWLRWRDGDGRLQISVGETTVP